jgi:tetraacyldisaccharide 4'-kinase
MSIGNITTGGTGKTPAVVMMAEWAKKEGYRVAVLSRGYGGSYRTRVLEVSDGEQRSADPFRSGDEPCLLAKRLAGVPVIISKRRYLAGLYASERFGSDFFILDDGFQHMQLRRDLDLTLIDAENPFGNGRLLPWGPLREPLRNLSRSNVHVMTRFSGEGSGAAVLDFLKREFPSTPVFFARHVPHKVVFPFAHLIHEPGFLKRKRVVAFAGIARPEAFKNTLMELGAEVVHFESFTDHHQYRVDEIRKLVRAKEKFGVEYLLTTEKDWVRMGREIDRIRSIGYLDVNFSLLQKQTDFFQLIRDAVHN